MTPTLQLLTVQGVFNKHLFKVYIADLIGRFTFLVFFILCGSADLFRFSYCAGLDVGSQLNKNTIEFLSDHITYHVSEYWTSH